MLPRGYRGWHFPQSVGSLHLPRIWLPRDDPGSPSLMLLAVLHSCCWRSDGCQSPGSHLGRLGGGVRLRSPRGFSRHVSPSGNGAASVPQPVSTTKVPTSCRPNCWRGDAGRDSRRPNFLAFAQPAVLVTPVLAPKMPPGMPSSLPPVCWCTFPGSLQCYGRCDRDVLAILVRRFAGAALRRSRWHSGSPRPRKDDGVARISPRTPRPSLAARLVVLPPLARERRGRWLLLLAGVTGWGGSLAR